MPSHFRLSIRFLAPLFHGRRDGGVPEWPPSPLRAFQSLVAAAARRNGGVGLNEQARSALSWLEKQAAPLIVAPAAIGEDGYVLSVPNNAMDIVARAWSRGNESNSGDANPATHQTMKAVRPTRLLSGDAVHYLWRLGHPLDADVRGHLDVLSDIARSIVALGWGIDLVVGNGEVVSRDDLQDIPGERWLPGRAGRENDLRVPVAGTLHALTRRHREFLNRIGADGVLTPPPPLSAYATVDYRRGTDPVPHDVTAFSLLNLAGSGFRAFDTVRHALTVAGMMRHTAKLAANLSGWPAEKINAFILGHGQSMESGKHVAAGSRRFAYLPLPSIESRGMTRGRVAGSVRRVIVCCFAEDCKDELRWARMALSGQELIDERTHEAVAMLAPLPVGETIVHQYVDAADSWATVTPVVLPGYDDPAHYRRRLKHATSSEQQKDLLRRLDLRIDSLLRKAITHAGFPKMLADHAELEWRRVGFWPGSELADRYGVPDHLHRFPRLHVRILWRDSSHRPAKVPGPVCIGSGRYYGLGLFAAA